MSSHLQKSIQVCRVYTPPKEKNGLWILVDRLWPRGLKKETLAFDLWPKEITPSTSLRQWFHENLMEKWSEFIELYLEELKNNGAVIERIQEMAIQTPITLFYAAKDTHHNHAMVLREVIRAWPNPPDKTLLL
jgi:uncharacterized protein YeaO (DUF488 family)